MPRFLRGLGPSQIICTFKRSFSSRPGLSYHVNFSGAIGEAFSSACGLYPNRRLPDLVVILSSGHEESLDEGSVLLPPEVASVISSGGAVLGAGIIAEDIEETFTGGSFDQDDQPFVAVELLWFGQNPPAAILPYVSNDAGYEQPGLPDFGALGAAALAPLLATPESAGFVSLAPAGFNLGGLLQRFDGLFPAAQQVGCVAASVVGETGVGIEAAQAFVGGEPWAGILEPCGSIRVKVHSGATVGAALHAVDDSSMANAATALLPYSHRRGFALCAALQHRLFVPTHVNVHGGDSPERFLSCSVSTPDLPIFLLDIALFPGVEVSLRIFEPR